MKQDENETMRQGQNRRDEMRQNERNGETRK